jgi:hypothetical protein
MKKLGYLLGSAALAIPFIWYMIMVKFSVAVAVILIICQTMYIIGIDIICRWRIYCYHYGCMHNINGRCKCDKIVLDEERKCKSFDFE